MTRARILADLASNNNALAVARLSEIRWWDGAPGVGNSLAALTRINDWYADQDNGGTIVWDIPTSLDDPFEFDQGSSGKSLGLLGTAIGRIDLAAPFDIRYYGGGEYGGSDGRILCDDVRLQTMANIPRALRFFSDGLVANTAPKINISRVAIEANDAASWADEGLVVEDATFCHVDELLYRGGSSGGQFKGWAFAARANFGSSPVDFKVRDTYAINAEGRHRSEGLEGINTEGGQLVGGRYGDWFTALKRTTATITADASSGTTLAVNSLSWFTIDIVLDSGTTHNATVTGISGTTVTFTPALPSAAASGKKATLANSVSTTLSASASALDTSVTLTSAAIVALGVDQANGQRFVTHITAVSGLNLTVLSTITSTISTGARIWVGGKEPLATCRDAHFNVTRCGAYFENMIQSTASGLLVYRNQGTAESNYKGVHFNNSGSPGSQFQDGNTIKDNTFGNLNTDTSGNWIELRNVNETTVEQNRYVNQFLTNAIFNNEGATKTQYRGNRNLVGEETGNAQSYIATMDSLGNEVPKLVATDGATTTKALVFLQAGRTATVDGILNLYRSDHAVAMGLCTFRATIRRTSAGTIVIDDYAFNETAGAAFTASSTTVALNANTSTNQLEIQLTAPAGQTVTLEGEYNWRVRS